MFRLKGHVQEKQFQEIVMERSGQNLLQCLQCGKCSGSCPITSESVGGPRRLIARILGGMQADALQDPTWWYCVSCGSCATRCPVEINMYAVSTTLCEMAAEQGIKPSEPGIHLFEELFLSAVEKSGRAQEMNTALQFNLRSLKPFADVGIGVKMALKGNLSPAAIIGRGHHDSKVAQIFKTIKHKKKG